MTEVLHVIEGLSLGGGARAVVTAAKHSARLGGFRHKVISLMPVDPKAVQLAQQANVTVQTTPSRDAMLSALAQADIVQVDWWNSPALNSFLYSELPPLRLMICFHVGGVSPLQVITRELVDLSDIALTVCPYSYTLPVFQELPTAERKQKVRMVYAPADFERLDDVKRTPHSTFNVGYLGTLDFSKMHPRYISMSAGVDIPDVRFIVCGKSYLEDDKCLLRQVELLNKSHMFEFKGYVDNIQSILSLFDVYGYPLCEDTYAAAELNLQEVMFAGIPSVVFPYGGVKDLVINGDTGLIVHDEAEYQEAIEYLYHNPQERHRLGQNAREYAMRVFGGKNAAQQLNPIYEFMMGKPKRSRAEGKKHRTGHTHWQRGKIRGAELFAKFTGDAQEDYKQSMFGQDMEKILSAEKRIATSAAIRIMRSPGYGSITHYLNYFPDDGYLHLWSGLQLQYQRRFEEALSAFQAALNLGCDHWRVHWYIAQAVKECSDDELKERALAQVARLSPTFCPSHKVERARAEKQAPPPQCRGEEEPPRGVHMPLEVRHIINLFEERVYTFKPATSLLEGGTPASQGDLAPVYDREFQGLVQDIPHAAGELERLFTVYRLAKKVCRQEFPGNFVQYAEGVDHFTLVLAYVLKNYSRQPRLLYLIPAPGENTDTTGLPTDQLEEIYEKLGISEIMLTTRKDLKHFISNNFSIIGMIALLCVSDPHGRGIDGVMDMLSSQLIGGSIVLANKAISQELEQGLIHGLHLACPPVRARDGTRIWSAKLDRFPSNPDLPPHIVSTFQKDDYELRYIPSQMSTNERFQIHYTLSQLLHNAKRKPLRFIEIGSYAGASLMLAYRVLKRNFSTVEGIAIDPEVNPTFFEAVREAKDEITHLNMKSNSAAPLLRKRFGQQWASFILVDGDHSYEAAREDITNYYPFLEPGGVMLFHDFLPALDEANENAIMIHHAGREPGIRRACQELLEDTHHCAILDAPLLFPTNPAQSQAHLPIIPNIHSTIRIYRK